MSPRKRQRLGHSTLEEEEEDIISALLDPLLHHILSFIPTKDTAVTSLLSKRWKPLFLSQLTFNFDDKDFPNAPTGLKFFNSFTTNRDNAVPILSLNLKFRKFSRREVQTFIIDGAIVNLTNLKTLSIDVDQSYSVFPSIFLTSKTLSVLKLKCLTILDDVPHVHLPLLKALHMESVTFKSHEYLWKLLSGVPLLEELETKDLIVNTPYGDCRCCSHSQRRVACFSKLVKANIRDKYSLFDWFHNVEHLRLQVTPLLLLGSSRLDNMFHNLTRMELIFDPMPALGKLKWSWLIKLLGNFPKLQTLIIDEVDSVNFGEGDWEDPTIVPECLLSHLTTCSLRNYSHINCELRFAKYILQNSRVLSTMTIQSAKFVETNTKLQMLNELSMCPMNSATCKLLFI